MKTLLPLLLSLVLLSCFDFGFDDMPKSSEKELKENYDLHHNEISELKKFYNSITPKDLEIEIEFDSDKQIDLKVYYVTKPKFPRQMLFQEWDINPYNYKEPGPSSTEGSVIAAETKSLDSVKKRLGWTNEIFKDIKSYLDKANCISITNGNPTNIGFRRSGMSMYFYNLFDNRLNDSLKTVFNDSCKYRLYNDTLALEYGGGAIGPQCFPKE
jgi:hypothetical protein